MAPPLLKVTVYPIKLARRCDIFMTISLFFWDKRGEDCALAFLAGDFELAAMAREDMFDDGQAKPGAAELAACFGIDAIESLGQAGDVVLRDAGAEIADMDSPGRLPIELSMIDADGDAAPLI